MAIPHISVCICTFRRPDWLRRLLLSLTQQRTEGLFTYSIVVADNDTLESAKSGVAEFAAGSTVPVIYCVEPEKNIALVRNRAIASASGDWIAFIDDDEFPIPEWLLRLFQACLVHQAAGALGPVRPHFEVVPPSWVKKSGLYDRREFETGFVLPWRESRTGNVLFRKGIIPETEPPFDSLFPNGGEDQDFFRRMMAEGHRFVWCNEAVVLETVPPIRWNKKVMMQRALLRGQNTYKHAKGASRGLVKSLVAIPVYVVALPFCALGGTHLVMRYLIKLCDHVGKLMAALGINSVKERAG
jgi:succinoglycan biosynthesis protein ExoM